MSESSAQSHCPYLGLEDDRGMYCLFPTEFHRCYRGAAAKAVNWRHQERYCLQSSYPECPIYQGARASWVGKRRRLVYAAIAAWAVVAALALLALTGGGGVFSSVPVVSVPAVTTPSPTSVMRAAFGTATVDSSASRILTATAEARLSFTATPMVPATATSTSAATVATPSPSPTPTLPPTLAATPIDEPEESPPVTSTPIPTPTPRIHVVAAGESLTGIAARYQTTIDAILRANGLTNRNYIFSGQRLIIP